MSANGHLIEIQNVRKSFGSQVVLDGIDMSIVTGEAVVVAGPSGSGKSTEGKDHDGDRSAFRDVLDGPAGCADGGQSRFLLVTGTWRRPDEGPLDPLGPHSTITRMSQCAE